MRPEKIRFEREINGRKVCKKFIAGLEPVLLFEDGYIRTYAPQYCKLQLAPANDTSVGFANIKHQIACILKGFNKFCIGTFK